MSSPAKFNWGLHVGDKIAHGQYRGYHQITTIMQALTLADTLTFDWDDDVSQRSALAGNPLRLTIGGNKVLAKERCQNPKGNLINQAYEGFYQAMGVPPVPVHIHLDKIIPTQAGLGGGSSNAATVLTTLNQYHHQALSPQQLHQLAAQCGCDVPFFLSAKPALASHVGEVITPLPLPSQSSGSLSVLVVKPTAIHMPTGQAYQALNRSYYKNPADYKRSDLLNNLADALQQGHWAKVADYSQNDFEGPMLSTYPASQKIQACLADTQPILVRLAGSGSGWIAVYPPSITANECQKIADDVTATLASQQIDVDLFQVETLI